MRPEDIRNIERLTKQDAMDLLRAIREIAPHAIDKAMGEVMDSWKWPDSDDRWGLTPHEMRKLNRHRQLAK